LAARLTGWDVDILTPAEFQAGVQRLDKTLKSVEGIAQEMVDKVIALGLIDVRDIEEVGTGPLMEELGLTEEVAQVVVDKAAEEAKIVAVEQEAKRAAEASAKAAGRAAGPNALEMALAGGPVAPTEVALTQEASTQEASTEGVNGNRMPGAMEAAEGGAPETVTHGEHTIAGGDELSPEELAIHPQSVTDTIEEEGRQDRVDDENTETADLAEGRTSPPTDTQDEPHAPAEA
jgi:N utilization substance protein A